MEAGRDTGLTDARRGSVTEVFGVALRLGLTSFGGPVAHIGFFRDEYVGRRRWLDEGAFSELVAVTSLLPGPSSSQLGIAIGANRAGRLGGLAAWVGFTLPSAVAMTVLALAVGSADLSGAGWVHGLALVAVPVVATAVLGMQRSLAPDLVRLALAVAAATVAISWGGFAGQAAAIALGAIVGIALFRNQALPQRLTASFAGGRLMATGCIAAFGALLLGLPALADATGAVALVDAMFRSGSLVFGGGHVVLPLLDEAVVSPGWVGEQEFLAGYGLAQAMPGPLFAFSAYLGAIQEPSPNGVAGAALAVGAIFLPSFLLLGGVLPLWSSIRRHATVQAALAGVGAAVVGLLAAALWDPVLRTSIDDWADVFFAVVLLALLRLLPVWAVVPIAAAAGALLL
ncbi:MAG TPA: chromate efflux transporter [Gaiella sp.]|uniref:chromate efflux transporter n=1 Tax=Gaiella sp. TaxID=2663207 RepID=UPI002D806450|nr:chromate efflux transporter [Gaiella sp.]HET9287091.1 chromate efflux transporter [Gaiella sp.]